MTPVRRLIDKPRGRPVALKEGAAQPAGVLLAFEVDDLPAELKRLRALGVAAEGPVKSSPEGYRRDIIRDPDGYRLSLFDTGKAPDEGGRT